MLYLVDVVGVLGVHLAHDHVIVELHGSSIFYLHLFEHHLRLLEAALANRSLLDLGEALVKDLGKSPLTRGLLLEEEGYFVVTTAYIGGGVNKGSTEEGVSFEYDLFCLGL